MNHHYPEPNVLHSLSLLDLSVLSSTKVLSYATENLTGLIAIPRLEDIQSRYPFQSHREHVVGLAKVLSLQAYARAHGWMQSKPEHDLQHGVYKNFIEHSLTVLCDADLLYHAQCVCNEKLNFDIAHDTVVQVLLDFNNGSQPRTFYISAKPESLPKQEHKKSIMRNLLNE